jgi:hypothetical protein
LTLVSDGPMVWVTIGVGGPIAERVREKGEAIPAPISGWALLDTGTPHTCIDEAAAKRMGLPHHDVQHLTSVGNTGSEHMVYSIEIEVRDLPAKIDTPYVIGATLEHWNIIALLGRDVLHLFTFYYNGPTGEVTISI